MFRGKSLAYEWISSVQRGQALAMRKASEELREWANSPRLPSEVASEAQIVAAMIMVHLPEEGDDPWGQGNTSDGDLTVRERFSEETWPPAEGQAIIDVFQIRVDIPVEVLAKIDEIFEKHGVLDIWYEVRREGFKLLRGAWLQTRPKNHRRI